MNDTRGGIQWVLPSIDPAFRYQCLDTMRPHIVERTLVVDNSPPNYNRGVPASWNLGVERAIHERAEWLVICSESVRFGAAGGSDIEDELADDDDSPWLDIAGVSTWHLVAFRTETLARVGPFDENFYPAYMEDSDYLIRLHLAGFPSPRENHLEHRWICGCDVADAETEAGHCLRNHLVTVDFRTHLTYWRAKWGADSPGYMFTQPFNQPGKSWDWWPQVARSPA